MGKADSIPARILLSLLETAPFPIVYPATAAMTLLDHSFTPSSASSLSNNSVSQSQQQKQQKKQHLVPIGAAPHALESVFDSGYPSPGLLVDGSTPRLPLDLVETETAWFARFDCAGVPKDLVKVDVGVRSRDLRVTVTRKRAKQMIEDYQKRGSDVLRWERVSGSSSRRVVFPLTANLDKIQTSYEDGMLTIKIPKTDDAAVAGNNHISVKVEACMHE